MSRSRIKLSYYEDEQKPAHLFSDHDWVRRHYDELLEQYGEIFIVVYKEAVIATGDTYEIAIQNVENNLPPGDDIITPIVRLLRHRHPFLRVRPEILQTTPQNDV